MVDNCIIYFLIWTLVLLISSCGSMYATGNTPSRDLNNSDSIEKPVFPPDADLRIDPVNNTIIYLKGTNLLPQKQDKILSDQSARETAISFIDHYKVQFKLDHPEEELRCVASNTDTLGLIHLRFQQVFNDVDVWGKEINIHLDKSHGVRVVQGRYIPTPRHMETTPIISSAVAVDKAASALNITQSTRSADFSQLIIFAESPEEGIRLAYKVEISNWLVFVDAKNGDILERITLRQTSRNASEFLRR